MWWLRTSNGRFEDSGIRMHVGDHTATSLRNRTVVGDDRQHREDEKMDVGQDGRVNRAKVCAALSWPPQSERRM